MIRSGPSIEDVRDEADVVCFSVCVTVDAGDMPGVSVKAAPGTTGAASVVSATVLPQTGLQGSTGDVRAMRFDVEADKSALAWQVAVVVTCAGASMPLSGPSVRPLVP